MFYAKTSHLFYYKIQKNYKKNQKNCIIAT